MTLRLLGLYNGVVTPDDGKYVVDYDPEPRLSSRGEWVYLITTDDPSKARQFSSAADAMEYWRRSYGLRPDGKPNRPLTAYTVEIA